MNSFISLIQGREGEAGGEKKTGIWVATDIWAIGLFYHNSKYKLCNDFYWKTLWTHI